MTSMYILSIVTATVDATAAPKNTLVVTVPRDDPENDAITYTMGASNMFDIKVNAAGNSRLHIQYME